MTSEIDELIKRAEVTTGAVLLKKVFWKISQNSQVFSCQFCETFKNTFFTEDLRATVSETVKESEAYSKPCQTHFFSPAKQLLTINFFHKTVHLRSEAVVGR